MGRFRLPQPRAPVNCEFEIRQRGLFPLFACTRTIAGMFRKRRILFAAMSVVTLACVAVLAYRLWTSPEVLFCKKADSFSMSNAGHRFAHFVRETHYGF